MCDWQTVITIATDGLSTTMINVCGRPLLLWVSIWSVALLVSDQNQTTLVDIEDKLLSYRGLQQNPLFRHCQNDVKRPKLRSSLFWGLWHPSMFTHSSTFLYLKPLTATQTNTSKWVLMNQHLHQPQVNTSRPTVSIVLRLPLVLATTVAGILQLWS